MPPQHERPYCFAHDPERAAEAAEARRMGGLRRRKEGTIAVAYDLPGLDTAEGVRRIFEIVRADLLGQENTIGRARALIAVGVAATNLLKTSDFEERLAALEAAHRKDEEAGVPRSLPGGLLGEPDR
jgi:hypothetical protein